MTTNPRRRFRLSLRSLFVLMFVVAILLGTVVRSVYRAESHLAMVKRLEIEDQTTVGYGPPPAWMPEWLSDWLGPAYCCEVEWVDVGSEYPKLLDPIREMRSTRGLSASVAPERAQEVGSLIASLPNLKELQLSTPEILPHIQGKTSLTGLSLWSWTRGPEWEGGKFCLTDAEKDAHVADESDAT